MWRFILILWWLGIVLSFLATLGLSAYHLLAPGLAGGERAGALVGLWLRWVFGLVGAVVALFVLAFILAALGVPVSGISAAPR